MESIYRIGAIRLKIISNSSLPFSNTISLDKFQIRCKKGDIAFFYNEENQQKIFSFSKETAFRLKNRFAGRFKPNAGTFICLGAINYFEDCKHEMDDIQIESHPFSIAIFNFNRNELVAFYSKSYASHLNKCVFRHYAFSHFLVNFSAIMIHGSSIVRMGKTALFMAPDAGGKSTIVGSATSGQILSDDQTLIQRIQNQFVAFSTPWGQVFDRNASAPLAAIFLLEKGQEFKIFRIEKKLVVQYLWNEHISNFYLLPMKLKNLMFDLILEIANSIPSYKIIFTQQNIDWNAIDKTLETSSTKILQLNPAIQNQFAK